MSGTLSVNNRVVIGSSLSVDGVVRTDTANGYFLGVDEPTYISTDTEFNLLRTSNGAGIWGYKGSSNNRGDLIFKTHSTQYTPVENMRITYDGNVGVGTSSPGAKLHVSGSTILSGGNVTITSRLTLSGGAQIHGSGASGPLIIDPNYSSNNYILLYDEVVVSGHLSVTGNVRLASTLSVNRAVHIKQHHDFGTASNLTIASASLAFERAENSQTWHIAHTADADLAFYFASGTVEAIPRGYLADDSNVSNIDFTGQHRSTPLVSTLVTNVSNYIGRIVISAGTYNNISGSTLPTINEALPVVDLASTYQDKRVYGVISELEDEKREYAVGAFVSVFQKEAGDNKLIINAVGEGGIWVCDSHGDLENGDYITSSNVPGYGAKQDDDLQHNYTVAKITQNENFEDMTGGRYINSSGITITEAEYNSEKRRGRNRAYKARFVGCTYHCG
jgi:cytoskeletal protein CcmA (bactofilin family)